MKVCVLVRTLNEAATIDRFCRSYQWADHILVADGGSDDDTIKRAKRYPNVLIRSFETKVMNNGYWRNPHGLHINFLIDWAREEGCEWMIFDDADCVPAKGLREKGRWLIDYTTEDTIFVHRLYVYGKDQYFPDLNIAQSLWAWKTTTPIRASTDDPWQHTMEFPMSYSIRRIDPPMVLLHYSWPNEEETERKLDFYRQSGEQVNAQHPLDFGGRLDPLPEYAQL